MKKQIGFSLIECIVVLSIFCILSLFILPSWSKFRTNQESQIWRDQLSFALTQAREQAVLYGHSVGVCGSNDGLHCLSSIHQGILVFWVSATAPKNDYIQKKIAYYEKKHGLKEVIYHRAFPWYRSYIQFNANGLLQSDNATYWSCLPKKKYPIWGFALSNTGNIRELKKDELKKLNCK